ncbi:MAG: DUF4332 domain-containing protein [Pirellulaceae bacterium]
MWRPSVDSVAAARLRGIGIESVGDLLTANAANIAARLGLAGVNDQTIKRWQIEADLVCRVPGLRPFDSRVLVGCGISRPQQLSQLHPTELLEKVEHFLSTDLGRETLRSGTSYELSRLTTWIASASRSVLRNRTVRDDGGTTIRRTVTRNVVDHDERERSSRGSDGSRRTVRTTRRRRRSQDSGTRDASYGYSTSDRAATSSDRTTENDRDAYSRDGERRSFTSGSSRGGRDNNSERTGSRRTRTVRTTRSGRSGGIRSPRTSKQ